MNGRQILLIFCCGVCSLLLLAGMILWVPVEVGYCVNGNCQDGHGTKKYKNGKTYVGSFRAGKRHGMGRETRPDGGMYEGSYENDVKQGSGTITVPSVGARLTAEWFQGAPEGLVIFELPGVVAMRGIYKNGRPQSGDAFWKYADGTLYAGGWKEGKRHGFGTLYARDRTVLIQGQWLADQPAMARATDQN